MFKFDLGQLAHDVITGLKGIITGRCDYISGCRQYLVQPKAKSGEYQDSHWIDEDRLKIVGKGVTLAVNVAGPDKPAPRR